MKYDTAGNEIKEMKPNCDCGLTGGCGKCSPLFNESFIGCISHKEAEEMKKKWNDYKKRFNEDFNRKHLELWGEKIIGEKDELLTNRPSRRKEGK